MSDNDFWSKRVKEGASLSPVDRTAEILFGLIMVLTFTGALRVASGGHQEVRELLRAALACNVAWGMVDAIMYLMEMVIVRAHAAAALKKIAGAKEIAKAREVIQEELPPYLSALMKEEEVDELLQRLKQVPVSTRKIWLTAKDWLAALQIFLLVFLCTFPVAIPFGIFTDIQLALRVSNGVALLMLFIVGLRLAHYASLRPVVTALAYTMIGVVLVFLTMAMGG